MEPSSDHLLQLPLLPPYRFPPRYGVFWFRASRATATNSA